MTTHEYKHTIEQILGCAVAGITVFASDILIGKCVVKFELKSQIETFILDEVQKQLKPCEFDFDQLIQMDADQLMDEFNK